ncbi:polyprenyl synthetase family protein [Corynebacterium aquilae]|uniref:Geranylgeranyl pyrophosphate synthase n=1 Tax=Corynebacterium aquilae DSM 44791 TaxID=1431546 RepID=A0A1L7CGW2_9CORY|nr:polyprenyl synthetase family protein [Corynebacterium aquilae]APT85101.1 geranylgeranyl pyrophosphate synthase [Corynebacterium aquilae DSM 44791]
MSTADVSALTPDNLPAAVTQRLDEFLTAQCAVVDDIDNSISYAGQLLKDFCLGGGKRIRPLYAWAGFVGAGGLDTSINPDHVLSAISSLELIQACALIHDDIIDASDTRRGQPTVHKAVQARHSAHSLAGDGADFGAAVAILLGDLALAWSDDMLLTSGLDGEILARVRTPWQAMRTEVIGGQILDISAHAAGDESMEEAWKINRFKTAAYTIERPLHIGAAIAGADADIIQAYRAYGRDIGIAFQLRDDLLGVFGDPAVTGKPAGDDLREGKRTVLFATAVQQADKTNPEAARYLRDNIGRVETPEDIRTMSNLLIELGAVDRVEEHISQLTASGLAALENVTLAEGVGEMLTNLAIKATARRA